MDFVYYIIAMVASYVISAALRPKPEAPNPAAMADFKFPQADEGTPQPVIFGDCWTGDWMVLGVGGFNSLPIESGGKK